MPTLTVCRVVRTAVLLGPERMAQVLKIILAVETQAEGRACGADHRGWWRRFRHDRQRDLAPAARRHRTSLSVPPGGDRQESARTLDSGHGCIAQRNITTREAWEGESTWPGLAQICAIGRHVITQKTGEERGEIVYGVTSVRPCAGATRAAVSVGPWALAH